MRKIKPVFVILLSIFGLQAIAAKLDTDYSLNIKEVSSSGKGVDNHGERVCGTRIVK